VLLCPTCRRRFDEAGFCPFDGTALVAGSAPQHETIVAGARASPPRAPAAPAAPAAPLPPDLPTQFETRRRTFPLTPSPSSKVAKAGTGEITTERTRPGPELGQARMRTPSDPQQLRVQSASDNPAEALELFRTSRESEYDKLVGQTLDGRYYVEAKIGEGGMGVVFRARHSVIERPLAIKVLKREAMRDTATIRRFVQEAKAASRIGHPNIVDVTDFGTTPDGMTYSVMEFVPGKTLGAALREGAPFAAPRAMRITAQIARALAAAHDKGIVHRDLKPENVFLLDRDGRQDFVKIVDFGIAKVKPPPGHSNEPRLTRAGSVFGTPEYMAPEQAAGRSDTDGRVDIYALGVLLYEMLCGRVPHRGESMVRTLAMQMLDPIEPPSKVRPDLAIPPALEAVVMHALIKKRDQRYQTMGELLEALDSILPPPIGQSVTGSPIYTLAALPPGADPGIVASLPAMPLQSSEAPPAPAASPPRAGAEAATQPARRPRDEPEFTADDRPVSFDHVFTEELVQIRSRRWPLLLLFALIFGGASGAIALVLKSRSSVMPDVDPVPEVIPAPADAGPAEDAVAIDAPQVVIEVADAAVVEPAIDAGEVAIHLDAGLRVRAPEPDDAPLPAFVAPNRRGTVQVQVLTRPEGALLYEGSLYRGPGGAQLAEPFGTRLVITCTQTGYKPGTVEVVFDGNTEAVLCALKRIRVCINNIKNPFDDCDEAPSQEPPP
jgi:serine/threonine protein kinase